MLGPDKGNCRLEGKWKSLMSQEERYGDRDGTYSAWHRKNSTKRYVGIEHAQLLAMIDVDVCLWVEYDDGTKDPVLLVETARDVGQEWKPSIVTQRLAERACVPAVCLLYTPADDPNPADDRWPDIKAFRARMIQPYQPNWLRLSPEQWAKALLDLRKSGAQVIDKLLGRTS